MKVLCLLALITLAYANANVLSPIKGNTAYGYIQNYAIPIAAKIREREDQMNQHRIVGGSASGLGDFPYQAGLLADYAGLEGVGVCGGSLVSANRVITAAHCWNDGVNQAWRFTVVLGSITLFGGGTRVETSVVAVHPNWFPLLVRNDVAVIYLPNDVTFSDAIAPIALPSGAELLDSFAGENGVASGFGLTADGGSLTTAQFLSHVRLSVISNNVCFFAFPLNLHDSNICTSGLGGTSVCRGDSGGPLVVSRNGKPVLIGITSFGHQLGCEAGMPAVFARVTSFMNFFNEHL